MIELAEVLDETATAGGDGSMRTPKATEAEPAAPWLPRCHDAGPWPPVERVAAIVPAYDEATTIGDVLAPLIACARQNSPERVFDEVLVVSDGSTDGTAEVARSMGVSVVELPANTGKAAALARGVAHTTAGIVLFVDADLAGFDAGVFRRLVRPVVAGSAAMVVGIRDHGRRVTEFHARQHGPLLSGVRCLRREVFEAVPDGFVRGFRIETALNWTCRRLGGVLLTTPLYGIRHRIKERKRGLLRGFAARLLMFASVFWAFLLLQLRRPPLHSGAARAERPALGRVRSARV